jgi:hypothetical protein
MGLLIDLLGDSQMRFSNSLIAIAAILAAAFSAPVAQAVPLTGDQINATTTQHSAPTVAGMFRSRALPSQ